MVTETQESFLTTSTQPQHTEPSQQDQQDEWTEAQYEAALAHLERLQNQIDNLRSTIPSLVAPLSNTTRSNNSQASKTQMFAAISKSASQAREDISGFRASWTSEETQGLFRRCRTSVEAEGDLSRAQDVARWGWGGQGD